MPIIQTIDLFVTRAIVAITLAATGLILLRSLFNYLDTNPFTWKVRTVRRLTDPVIAPVRWMLISFRLEPRVAPFVAIVLIGVIGYLAFMIADNILNTIAGVLYALSRHVTGATGAIIGYLLFGFLGLYILVIFLRILFSYLTSGYGNRWVRFMFQVTEPLLAPMRRMIPTMSMFDISPLIAFIILYLLQFVVAGTLLKGWPVRFF